MSQNATELPVSIYKSDSSAQSTAENLVREWLATDLGFELVSAPVKLPGGCSVQIDGYNAETKIACEIYCRVGRLKGSQSDKIDSDILKLVLVEKELGGQWQKIICFVDDEAARVLGRASWLSVVVADFGVQCRVAPLSDEIKQKILGAQKRQKMVNTSEEVEAVAARRDA